MLIAFVSFVSFLFGLAVGVAASVIVVLRIEDNEWQTKLTDREL